MSQICGVASSNSHYFDESKAIWYTKDGVAITTLHSTSFEDELSHDLISDYFSGFGIVCGLKIYKNPSHSFGYVTFTQAEAATKLLAAQHNTTIFGRQIKVAIPERECQPSTIKFIAYPVKNLLDLNDCLFEILSPKYLSRHDLCSVARTCVRLKEIANQIFFSKCKSCDLRISAFKGHKDHFAQSRRILVTFGAMISELFIDNKGEDLLDLATKCCSVEVLESLQISGFFIPREVTEKLKPFFSKLVKLNWDRCSVYENDENGKKLFGACESLVELKLYGVCDYELRLILETTFPKLERFEHVDSRHKNSLILKSFITRHKNLKTLSLRITPTLMSTIAENCKELEELQIVCLPCLPAGVNDLNKILNLANLKKLTLTRAKIVPEFIKYMTCLKSLEFLELWGVTGDSELVTGLSKLKSLQVLRLRYCQGLTDLNALGDLDQLIELTIDSLGSFYLDVVLLVKRLINLKTLKIEMANFSMDETLYQRIVDVVRERPVPSQRTLQITCRFDLSLKGQGHHPQILKLIKVA